MEKMEGRCKFCFWNVNLSRCRPEKMITHSGTCQDWRLRKMTDEEKKRHAAIQKAAHVRDMVKRGKK